MLRLALSWVILLIYINYMTITTVAIFKVSIYLLIYSETWVYRSRWDHDKKSIKREFVKLKMRQGWRADERYDIFIKTGYKKRLQKH
jgi:hypothetical protein